jgi:hypothetical protein
VRVLTVRARLHVQPAAFDLDLLGLSGLGLLNQLGRPPRGFHRSALSQLGRLSLGRGIRLDDVCDLRDNRLGNVHQRFERRCESAAKTLPQHPLPPPDTSGHLRASPVHRRTPDTSTPPDSGHPHHLTPDTAHTAHTAHHQSQARHITTECDSLVNGLEDTPAHHTHSTTPNVTVLMAEHPLFSLAPGKTHGPTPRRRSRACVGHTITCCPANLRRPRPTCPTSSAESTGETFPTNAAMFVTSRDPHLAVHPKS